MNPVSAIIKQREEAKKAENDLNSTDMMSEELLDEDEEAGLRGKKGDDKGDYKELNQNTYRN